MRIIQIINSIEYGNGVSKCMMILKRVLDELQYENVILTKTADERIKESYELFGDICEVPFEKEDILIYHFSYGCELNYEVERLPYRKILVYQNVTPPSFFRGININVEKNCLKGIADAQQTSGNYLKCITMSDFSKEDLVRMGWKEEDVYVIPLVELPEQKVMSPILQPKDAKEPVQILFTGRITPNKKQEDIINVFDYYNKYVNENSQLTFVGKPLYPAYYRALEKLVQKNVKNVVFKGHISDEELEECYENADIFLCLSEHEGLCIPLLEAMERQIPVIAYKAAAVPDTMGQAGILLDSKDPKIVSDYIQKIVTDNAYKEEIIRKQNERLQYFRDYEIGNKVNEAIKTVAEISNWKHENISEFEEMLHQSVSEVAYHAIASAEQIVIYGNGVFGKRFLGNLSSDMKGKIVAICDNGKKADTYNQVPIFNHEECVAKYPDAVYVITPKNSVVEITGKLLFSGIRAEQIKIYHAGENEVV